MELYELSVNGRTYKVFEKVLGVGYRSKVRAGICVETKERVAVKIVEKSSRESVNDRCRREIELLKKIQGHANIVRLLDSYEDDECMYVMLERHELTLLDYIERSGNLSFQKASRILRDIVSGLQHCALFSISHLDLKLENIMLSSTGCPVIIDFGFAEQIARGRQLTVGRGSFRYVCPEIAAYQGFEPAKADCWALGVLLFAMCSGRLPFAGDETNVRLLFKQICAASYDMPTSFPDVLRDLVAGLLQRDPDLRLELDEIAVHPFLTAWSNTAPVSGPDNNPGIVVPVAQKFPDMALLGACREHCQSPLQPALMRAPTS